MKYKTVLFLLLTAAATISCNPCNNLDCVSSNYAGLFRIVNNTNGEDLVFGPSRVYNKDQVKFYSVSGADSTFFELKAMKFPGAGYDSFLHVLFYPASDVVYMRLSNGDVDTFNLSFENFDTRCCGNITNITNFRFNNRIDLPGTKGIQEIRK